MQKPKISKGNEVLDEQKFAVKNITQGIEGEIKKLHILSTKRRLLELLFFVVIYCLGAYSVIVFDNRLLMISVGVFLMGVSMSSLGLFIHEGLHGLLSNNDKINHFLSFLTGLPLMVSATAYQATHNNHHYELGRVLDLGTYDQHTGKRIFVWLAYFMQLILGSIIYILVIPFWAFKISSSKERFLIVLEYFFIFTALVLFLKYVPQNIVLLFWLYPVLVSDIFTNIRGLATHALCNTKDVYLSSRNIGGSALVAYFFLNENFHFEHHLFPRVPSYNLLSLHSLTWSHRPRAIYSKSYINFLINFFKAFIKNDLSPMGVVVPTNIKN